MKIVMNGENLLSIIRNEEGFQIYIERSNSFGPLDRVTSISLSKFNPKPDIEILFPRDKTFILLIASMLKYCDRHEIVQVIKEYEREVIL